MMSNNDVPLLSLIVHIIKAGSQNNNYMASLLGISLETNMY